VTNEQGLAIFYTVYPGWYPKRATHIHVIVHVGATLMNMDGAIYTKGGHASYTGQIYFNDTLTDEVAKLSPYNLVRIRRVRNDEDALYSDFKGSTTIIPVKYLTSNGLRGAVSGDITLGIDPNTVVTSTVARP
jgi:protocatechuate 3,4-dioxygenase beta subunit